MKKIRSRRDQESASLEVSPPIALQRSARKVRPVGPCPEGTNETLETLVIDTVRARQPYVSASRGSHGGNQHSHGLYTTPESKMCGRWAPTIVERIQRHIHGQVPTTAMLKGKEQVKRACMLDTHVYINPWKVICRYTFSLSLHQPFPIPPFPASPLTTGHNSHATATPLRPACPTTHNGTV